jgi:hypothetical protein
MIRTSTLAAGAVGALLAGGITFGTAVAAPGDYNCPDFTYQEDAQEFFEQNGPGDPYILDQNNDGVACEDLPRRGGGTTNGGSQGGGGTTNGGNQGGGGTGDEDNDGSTSEPTTTPTENDDSAPAPTDDDDSTAYTSGSQIEVVPEGSADTGGV